VRVELHRRAAACRRCRAAARRRRRPALSARRTARRSRRRVSGGWADARDRALRADPEGVGGEEDEDDRGRRTGRAELAAEPGVIDHACGDDAPHRDRDEQHHRQAVTDAGLRLVHGPSLEFASPGPDAQRPGQTGDGEHQKGDGEPRPGPAGRELGPLGVPFLPVASASASGEQPDSEAEGCLQQCRALCSGARVDSLSGSGTS
jgi:hypothetical protein